LKEEESIWPWINGLNICSILDVGAHVGVFSKKMHSLFPQATIYAFEPQPRPFSCIEQWADNEDKVKIFNYALGDVNSTMKMFQYPQNRDGSATFLEPTSWCLTHRPYMHTKDRLAVKMRTLDSMMDELGKLEPEVFIKLDVEGYEIKVIQGGKELFQKAKLCLTEVQLSPIFVGQPTFQTLVDLFDQLGFRYAGNFDQLISKDDGIYMVDALFVR